MVSKGLAANRANAIILGTCIIELPVARTPFPEAGSGSFSADFDKVFFTFCTTKFVGGSLNLQARPPPPPGHASRCALGFFARWGGGVDQVEKNERFPLPPPPLIGQLRGGVGSKTPALCEWTLGRAARCPCRFAPVAANGGRTRPYMASVQ